MKTIYYVDKDSIYTSIVKREVSDELFEERLKENDCYFKTFSEAKKEAKSYIKYFLDQYKTAFNEISKLTDKDL